jgi:hypothetical protein
LGIYTCAGADQLEALLGPDTAAAGVDPRRPGVPVVERRARDGGVAVGGQRDGPALLLGLGASNRTGADQLVALLGPDTGGPLDNGATGAAWVYTRSGADRIVIELPEFPVLAELRRDGDPAALAHEWGGDRRHI